jgi:hypothetical protein
MVKTNSSRVSVDDLILKVKQNKGVRWKLYMNKKPVTLEPSLRILQSKEGGRKCKKELLKSIFRRYPGLAHGVVIKEEKDGLASMRMAENGNAANIKFKVAAVKPGEVHPGFKADSLIGLLEKARSTSSILEVEPFIPGPLPPPSDSTAQATPSAPRKPPSDSAAQATPPSPPSPLPSPRVRERVRFANVRRKLDFDKLASNNNN